MPLKLFKKTPNSTKTAGMERRDYGNYLRCVVPDCFQAKEVEISFHLFPDKKRTPGDTGSGYMHSS